MDEKFLLKKWQQANKSEMSSRQISIRLPVKIANRIDELLIDHPNLSKSQMISDLVSFSLDKIPRRSNG